MKRQPARCRKLEERQRAEHVRRTQRFIRCEPADRRAGMHDRVDIEVAIKCQLPEVADENFRARRDFTVGKCLVETFVRVFVCAPPHETRDLDIALAQRRDQM